MQPQPLMVGVEFFWIMVLIGFSLGIMVARWITRAERRAALNAIRDAAALMHEVAATLRASRNPLPIALHRRVCDFRARWLP